MNSTSGITWTLAAILLPMVFTFILLGAISHYGKLHDQFVRIPTYDACTIGKLASSFLYNTRLRTKPPDPSKFLVPQADTDAGSVSMVAPPYPQNPYWVVGSGAVQPVTGAGKIGYTGHVRWLPGVKHLRNSTEYGHVDGDSRWVWNRDPQPTNPNRQAVHHVNAKQDRAAGLGEKLPMPVLGSSVPADIQKYGGYVYFHRGINSVKDRKTKSILQPQNWYAAGPSAVFKVSPGTCK